MKSIGTMAKIALVRGQARKSFNTHRLYNIDRTLDRESQVCFRIAAPA